MASDTEATRDALETLAAVARLLCRCSDMAFACQPGPGRSMSSLSALGLGADLLATETMALIPGVGLDDPVPVQTDPVQLLRSAEELTRAHSIEQFPPGTSRIIARICDLLRQNPT